MSEGTYICHMPILPPKGDSQKTVPLTITLPRWMQERLDQLAVSRGYRSRSEVIARLLEWSFQELEREEKGVVLAASNLVYMCPICQKEHGADEHSEQQVEHFKPKGFTLGKVLPGPPSAPVGDVVAAGLIAPYATASTTVPVTEQLRKHLGMPDEDNTTGAGPRREVPVVAKGFQVRRSTEPPGRGVTDPAKALERAREKELRKKARDMQTLGHPVDYIAKELGVNEARVRELLEDEYRFRPAPDPRRKEPKAKK